MRLLRRFVLIALSLCTVTARAATFTFAPNAPTSNCVLIYGPSVTGSPSKEELQAAIAGLDVVVATMAQWSGMTQANYQTYRALVFGDPSCSGSVSVVAGAEANRTTWSPAVTGNVIVIGTDPVVHFTLGGSNLIARGICFAASDAAKTGAYVDLSCYYGSVPSGSPVVVPLLDQFGTFKTYATPCDNGVHRVANGTCLSTVVGSLPPLTDAVLGPWHCSSHEGFTVWPPTFDVFAIVTGVASTYVATDGTSGLPYILTRGTTVVSNIHLSPTGVTNPVGTTHTVTATIVPTPPLNTPVTFTVLSGPNAGPLPPPVPTNSAGQASKTYTDSGGAGTDFIVAKYTDAAGHVQTSNTVTKTWEAAHCAAVTPRALECDPSRPGVFNATFVVTNHTGGPVTSILLTPPAGSTYTLGQQVFPIPPLADGASTTISVAVSGASPGATLCLRVTLMNLQPVSEVFSCERCCCTVEVCFRVPDCDCAVVTHETLTHVSGTSYTYTFTVTNQSTATIQYVYIHLPAGVTVTPSPLVVSIPPGGSQTATVSIAGLASPNFCLYISLHDEPLTNCCVIQRCFGNIR